MRPMRWQSDGMWSAAKLLSALVAVAVVWLLVLPAIGQLAVVRRHIARNERQQIDPSAKFYTELPAMPQLLERTQRRLAE